jgi:hypothetical protein
VKAVERLNTTVAFTMSSDLVWSLDEQLTPLQTELGLRPGTVLPIAKSVRDIGTYRCTAKKDNFLCYCREENFVLVWGEFTPNILAHGNDVETAIMSAVSVICESQEKQSDQGLGLGFTDIGSTA